MEKPKYTRIDPNSNNISLPNQPYKGSWKENSNTRKVPAPKKGQDIKHLTTKPEGENHEYIKPPTKQNKNKQINRKTRHINKIQHFAAYKKHT